MDKGILKENALPTYSHVPLLTGRAEREEIKKKKKAYKNLKKKCGTWVKLF